MESLIVRRPEAARMLGVSESQFRKWERLSWIEPIKYPGLRAVGFDAQKVRELARRLINHEITA